VRVGFELDCEPTCGHHPGLGTADELLTPACGAAAVAHVRFGPGESEGTHIGTFACVAHLGMALLAAVQSHEVGEACGVPGSLWWPDLNECRMDWSGVEVAELVGQVKAS